MDHPKANISPSTEFSPAIIPNPEEQDLERNSDIAEDVEILPETKELPTPQKRDGVENTTPTPRKSLSFKLAFVGLAASLFVFQVDATCLGIALPTIAGELKGSSLESFWANLAYTLCGLVTQPVWASISNAFGRKPPLYVSMGLFFIGSIIFAIAQNMNTIIVARVLQGLGGGGLDLLVMVILADMTTLEERSRYLGLMAIPSAIGNIMGPVVGALFSTYATWRWIGWINLPLLGIGIPLVFFFLKLRPVPLDATLASNLKRLDWIGMALVIIGITIFVAPLSWAGTLFPWASWQTLLPLLLGVAVLVIFVFYEAKPLAPIIPYRIFGSKTGNLTLVGGFIHGIIMVSLLQYLPLLYQAVELESAISSALSLLPTVIISVVVAAVSMLMVPLFGGYVWLLRLSWVVLTLGTGLLALFDVGTSSSMRYGLPILWGQGVALLRLNILPMQASVKNVDDTSLAMGQFLAIRLFGGLVGLTISSAIFNNVFSASISNTTIQLTGALAPLKDASNAVNFIDELRFLNVSFTMLDEVLRVYLKCFQTIFYTMTGLSGLGLLTSVFLDEINLKGQDLGDQRFEE
ncbi:Major facilitator superfamily domain general substrate transporter [Penicillium hordei]|uniref:Major facilitator superfamily domain general substrate transporter n=1 Tax=Penicillium hordei TaxID=40994 RepID=A0AAD6E0K7_9EURO|nr:Major facilitator superfamily domain general substrate transporter [Penicillium hordei]KAJ5598377.1 Major facilitator superfamily domain general substrate transporter [Penicillium hordei]